MGIALLALADFFTPLQSLAHRWLPARTARRGGASGLRYVTVHPACATRAGSTCKEPRAAQQALRVVRVVEPGSARTPDSRVVISGRMADVCAELDRLAALEAAGSRPDAKRLH